MKNLLLIAFLLGGINCYLGDSNIKTENFNKKPPISYFIKKCDLRQKIIKNAKKYIGTPYKYGGCEKGGFDCSGFVFYQYKKLGITIPRSSRTQIGAGKKVEVKNTKVGDIVVFTGTNRKKRQAGHTGIVYKINSKDNFDFIHSSSVGGVKISNINDGYYSERFLQIRDILSEECG